MAKFTNPLSNVKIASPCKADWNEMIGNEQKRFCGQCKLNVYNLSGMSKVEAEKLLLNSEGRLCVRFYRRADGTVLTEDCPVGWQAVKRRASQVATAAFSLVAAVLGGLGMTSAFSSTSNGKNAWLAFANRNPTLPLERTMGAIAPMPMRSPSPKATPKKAAPMMGDISSEPLTGEIALPRNSNNNRKRN